MAYTAEFLLNKTAKWARKLLHYKAQHAKIADSMRLFKGTPEQLAEIANKQQENFDIIGLCLSNLQKWTDRLEELRANEKSRG